MFTVHWFPLYKDTAQNCSAHTYIQKHKKEETKEKEKHNINTTYKQKFNKKVHVLVSKAFHHLT